MASLEAQFEKLDEARREAQFAMLLSRLALGLCDASDAAHELYAVEPSGAHGAAIKKIQSHFFHAMEELKKITWNG